MTQVKLAEDVVAMQYLISNATLLQPEFYLLFVNKIYLYIFSVTL